MHIDTNMGGRTMVKSCRMRALVAYGVAGLGLLVASMLVTSSYALAQAAFPGRPLTLVSPFAAGGTSDTVARAAARLLEKDLGQSVVVVNRPGAGGTIGVGSVLAAPPDGHTVVLGGLGSIVFPAVLYRSTLKYDPEQDLTALGVLGVAPTLILVRADFPAQSLQELVAYANTRPGAISYGSAGVGGTLHLAGVLFEQEAGVQLNHVPYKGGAPAMVDLAGGTVDMAFADLTLAGNFLKSGRVRALAVASATRLPALDHVPTTREAGYPGVQMDTWYGLFIPAAAPAESIARWQAAVDQVQSDPNMRNALTAQFIIPANAPLPAFQEQIARDFATWIPMINDVCFAAGCK